MVLSRSDLVIHRARLCRSRGVGIGDSLHHFVIFCAKVTKMAIKLSHTAAVEDDVKNCSGVSKGVVVCLLLFCCC